jgi:hypothetical protein
VGAALRRRQRKIGWRPRADADAARAELASHLLRLPDLPNQHSRAPLPDVRPGLLVSEPTLPFHHAHEIGGSGSRSTREAAQSNELSERRGVVPWTRHTRLRGTMS